MGRLNKLVFFIVIFFSVFSDSFPQDITAERVNDFFNILINDKDGLEAFVLPEELAVSKRLGIEYERVKYKFMIGYDIDEKIKKSIVENKNKYDFDIETTDDGFSKVNFKVPELNYSKTFYFSGEYLVSQIYYFTHDWKKTEGKYFVVYYRDETEFNNYSLIKLDDFVESKFAKFNLSNIEHNKIYYFLCKDQDEIENLTGYKTLGLSNLGYDYVISTFNCHYHECSHILINVELKKLPLYTHPFLQEGFAVAMGGRGGREPGIILELGAFIQNSGYLDYSELLDRKKFLENDASMSYALSGVFNYYLLYNYYSEYFKLYLKYSTSEIGNNNLIIDSDDLPGKDSWRVNRTGISGKDSYGSYPLTIMEYMKTVFTDSLVPEGEPVLQNEKGKIYYFENYSNPEIYPVEKTGFYYFRLKDTLLLNSKVYPVNYISKKFREVFPDKKYNGEKYLIVANQKELQVYNLFTNNLIANFVSSFQIPYKEIPLIDGWLCFSVKAKVFDEKIEQLTINN